MGSELYLIERYLGFESRDDLRFFTCDRRDTEAVPRCLPKEDGLYASDENFFFLIEHAPACLPSRSKHASRSKRASMTVSVMLVELFLDFMAESFFRGECKGEE